MASSISSLGIGSGVLTSDVLEQLQEVDEANVITPLETKSATNTQEQESLTLLSSLMSSFKASTSALSYDTLFDSVNVDVSGEAEVEVQAGANVDSFTLKTLALAQKDVTTIGEFTGENSALVSSGESGVLNLSIGDTDYSIEYDDTTTLDDLAQSITDAAGSAIDASVLETSDGKFTLILSSTSTGADQTISIEDTADGTSGTLGKLGNMFSAYNETTNPDGYQKAQEAQDSKFEYNGIIVNRSTNEIDDLIVGVSIKLREEGDISNISISQDEDSITTQMNLFVESYNTLMTNLSDMTAYDEDGDSVGIFQSNSFIKGITSDINTTINSVSSGGVSLIDFGIEIDRYGTMSFDESTFSEKLSEDPDALEEFFTGGTDSNGNSDSGIFEKLNDKLDGYTGYGELLSTFEDSLITEGNNITNNITNAQASIDTRYEIMATKFAAYDSIINAINTAFTTLEMIMDAETDS